MALPGKGTVSVGKYHHWTQMWPLHDETGEIFLLVKEEKWAKWLAEIINKRGSDPEDEVQILGNTKLKNFLRSMAP